MTTGAPWDATGTRFVRKGCTVRKDDRQGVVVKANGPSCFVQWPDEPYSQPEQCADLTVIDLRSKGDSV